MKKHFVLLTLILLLFPLAAQEGSMAGAGKLRVSQTKYFDIIYSQKNLAAADILYQNADAVLEELAAAYGVDPYFRLPVVITTSVEQFNAYYSDSPFNRIVIYDTAQIDDLAVFSQTLLSTFTHELTHALTYNLKSKGMRIAGKIFGDAISSHYITVTSGMAEGATLSYESSKGEGRLNDAYSLQMLRQAKIEGRFPSYSDVKGASDAYPRNSFYYFNGAFADFLQKNFGMHKYAEFWYRCINTEHLSDLTAAGAFKKTFGIKLNRAWKMFEDSLYLPPVAGPDPVALGQADDFFEPGRKKLSIKNRAGSLYSNLTSSKAGLAFMDQSSDTVYFYSQGKIKKLFTRDYLDTIRLSQDGRFLAVGYYTAASPTIKHCAALYDIQEGRWIKVSGTNYASPAVLSDGNSYYFIAQTYENQKYGVCIKKIEGSGRRVKVAEENLASRFFAAEEVPQDFTDLGQGNFAFILKSGLEFSLCLSNNELGEIQKYVPAVQGIRMQDLSASGSRLLFSWAVKENLPRLGYFDLGEAAYSFAKENISGGIYSPVLFEDHLYYTAKFFKETRLLELKIPFEEPPAASEASVLGRSDTPAQSDTLTQSDTTNPPAQLPYKDFSPFAYAFEGLLIPVGGLNSNTPSFGFTYLTSLPWYSSVTMISGGYEPVSKAGIFDLSYQSGSDTNLFQYSLDSSFAVDGQGFKFFKGSVQAATSFDFARISALGISAQANANYGRLVKGSNNLYFTSLQLLTLSYTNLIHSGTGTYERAGIKAVSGLVHSYEKQLTPKAENLLDLYDVEVDFYAYIPKLLPLTCLDNFTYNLPTKIKTYFFSLSSSSMRLAGINTETILFGYDIQKAVPGLSALFLNDILLTLGYRGGFDYLSAADYDRNWHFLCIPDYIGHIKNREIPYRDYMSLKLLLGFTPNIGSFANPQGRFNLYLSAYLGKKANLPQKVFDFGLEAKF